METGDGLEGLLTNHFPAHGEDAGVGFGGFGVRDVAEADVDLGEGGPRQKIVGPEGGSLERSPESLLELIGFQQDHGERVPAIEMVGIQFNAPAIEDSGLFEFTEGDVPAGLIEEGLDGFAQDGIRGWACKGAISGG
ncbi:MAG: hypothetical protein RL346_1223 [Verrucomicrobiota bacterium]